METGSFKKKLSERLWKIEGVMNELKNYHGLTKAKFRGLQNMQIQAYMAAIAVNIKRLIFIYIFLRVCRYSDQKISSFTTGRTHFNKLRDENHDRCLVRLQKYQFDISLSKHQKLIIFYGFPSMCATRKLSSKSHFSDVCHDRFIFYLDISDTIIRIFF